jgi:hypothetical protein
MSIGIGWLLINAFLDTGIVLGPRSVQQARALIYSCRALTFDIETFLEAPYA